MWAKPYGEYPGSPVIEDDRIGPEDVEISEDVVLLPRETALRLKEIPVSQEEEESTPTPPFIGEPQPSPPPVGKPDTIPPEPTVQALRRLSWEGDLPPQKWTQFYMKVLTHFATDPSLRLRIHFEVAPEAGITQTQLEEIRAALRELGLNLDTMQTEIDRSK